MNGVNVIKISTDDTQTPAHLLADIINRYIDSGTPVLWLISGGSCIKIAVVAQQLLNKAVSPDLLTVGLVDERFGIVGHDNSNAKKLLDAGFNINNLMFEPVLRGKTLQETATDYSALLDEFAKKSEVVIGLFGMGADGHTSGLLPGNPVMNSLANVATFKGFDFERVTTTPHYIATIDEAILYAVGQDKWPALKEMYNERPAEKLPVRILKTTKHLTLVSDYEGQTE